MIVIKNLWKRFGSLQVLKGLNLEVLEGETLVILGRSGVGKSVLLKQILGLDLPDRGTIEINGIDIDTVRRRKREALPKMGMLFQGGALFDSMTVGENVAFYLRQHEKLDDSFIANRIEEALRVVSLEGTQDTMPSDLSGGMRKRAALARLIAYRPAILLYDEPTTGLDPITAMQINELIGQVQRELSATSIVVTHDIRSALEVGDRLAFHSEGVITHIAPKKEFLQIEDPLLQAFFNNAIVPEKFSQQSRER
jgi:phospholipid/cholesterol/gamma-HCH transport system ATP-binding protein